MGKCSHKWEIYCSCDLWRYEPADDCRKHQSGEWPRKCDTCGQFIKLSPKQFQEGLKP